MQKLARKLNNRLYAVINSASVVIDGMSSDGYRILPSGDDCESVRTCQATNLAPPGFVKFSSLSNDHVLFTFGRVRFGTYFPKTRNNQKRYTLTPSATTRSAGQLLRRNCLGNLVSSKQFVQVIVIALSQINTRLTIRISAGGAPVITLQNFLQPDTPADRRPRKIETAYAARSDRAGHLFRR